MMDCVSLKSSLSEPVEVIEEQIIKARHINLTRNIHHLLVLGG